MAPQPSAQPSSASAPPPQLDVAIVGGGPGGLAAAKAILTARPDLRVAVFERSSLRPRGATLLVQPNGIRALAAISPELGERVEAVDAPVSAIKRYSADGSLVQHYKGEESPIQFIRTKGGPVSYCAWHQLQAGCATLAAALPPGVLHQEAPLERLEEGPTCLTLHLGGGRPPVTARLVVGADGGQSAVRRQVLNDGLPSYLDAAIWRFITPPPASWGEEAGVYNVYVGEPPAIINAVSLPSGSVCIQAIGAWPAERLEEIGGAGAAYVQDPVARREQGEARRRRALSVFGGWCPQVRDLLECVDPLAITEHPQFYREPQECKVWGRGRVTLLGDAAHLSTPFLGQGTSQAFEDALALGRAIGEHGASEAALRAYEAARQPQAEQVQAASVTLFKAFSQGGKAAPLEHLEMEKLGVWQRAFAPLRPPSSAAA